MDTLERHLFADKLTNLTVVHRVRATKKVSKPHMSLSLGRGRYFRPLIMLEWAHLINLILLVRTVAVGRRETSDTQLIN